jgi:hypothetical protein
MNLREQVDSMLPGWESWYPSLFEAAQDLGLIRARVCAPSSLLLSSRHASVQSEALQAFRERWSVEEPEDDNSTADPIVDSPRRKKKKKKISALPDWRKLMQPARR